MEMATTGHDLVGWLIVAAGTLATLWTIVFAIRAMVAPGETAADHPKRLILKDDR